MSIEREILEQFAGTVVPELQSVSKGFAPSFETSIEEFEYGISLTIYASAYIRTLIDGRKPTRDGAKRGNPTLQQIIHKWIIRHGIVPKAKKDGKVPTIEQLSWAISKSIHLRGTKLYIYLRETKLYQQGGGNHIFDPILSDQRINILLSMFAKHYNIKIENELIKRIKK